MNRQQQNFFEPHWSRLIMQNEKLESGDFGLATIVVLCVCVCACARACACVIIGALSLLLIPQTWMLGSYGFAQHSASFFGLFVCHDLVIFCFEFFFFLMVT